MSQRALCYLVHDLPSSNNAFQNKHIWIHYRQRKQITAVCLVFSSWSTSNLTHKFSKAYAIYWFKRLGQVSIRFLALGLFLKCCPTRANEELSFFFWMCRGLVSLSAQHLCVYVDLSVYCIRTCTLWRCPCFCIKFHHTHTNPQIVEAGFARCRRLCIAFLQIYRFANRRSDGSMGWVFVVKLFKSSSPLQTETAAVLPFEMLLATGQGPEQTTVVSRRRTSCITGSFSGWLIIARPRLPNILCNINNCCAKKNYTSTSLKGKIFMNGKQSIWLRVSSAGQIKLYFTLLTITY